MSANPRHRLGTRTLRGMFWSYGSYIGTRGSSLLATAVLTRILAPSDFGLVALAGTFMTFLDMLQGLGVGNALVVVKPEEVETQAETAFAVSSTVGLLLALITAALSPAAAALFHQPRLYSVMPALGLTFFFYGLGSTHYAIATKRMDFRSRTCAELVDAIFRGGVGVALALAGAGVWALVIGYSAGNIAMDVVLWKLVPWRPRFRPQRQHLRQLLSFGGATTAVGIMAAFLAEFDNLVVGRVLGVTALGYYSIATKLPYLFIISLASVAGDVLFPAFATLDDGDMGRAFLTALRYTAMVALPLTAVLSVLARPITLAVFGAQWEPAVGAAQVLCLWAVMSPISMVCGNALKSRGRAAVVLYLAIPQAIAIVVGSLLFVRDGIVVISWVQAVIAVVAQLFTILITMRMFRLTTRSVIVSIGPPLLASAGLAAALFGVHEAISAPWPAVILGGAVGLPVYAGLLHLLSPSLLPRLRAMAFPAQPATEPSAIEFESAIAAREPDAMVRPAPIPTREPGSA
ncbi:MAG TPA: lipopolysaccharide biosynthesis protein [Solirubrobacteraceae bacterium]|nr:lipopolysaccharide biosynthesis protein [Solirubrobacteraceae bacterium]